MKVVFNRRELLNAVEVYIHHRFGKHVMLTDPHFIVIDEDGDDVFVSDITSRAEIHPEEEA